METASSQPSSECIQFSSKDPEEAVITPHVVIIQKIPSREGGLSSAASKSSLDHTCLSANDALDAQKSGSDTAVVSPSESAEQRVAYIRTPSKDEIRAEVSQVRIRSPRLSPLHSSGDVSEKASAEHLQVSTPVLVLTPNVSAEDVSEPQSSVEEMSLEEKLDVVKCLSHDNLERKSSEMAAMIASPPITPSGKYTKYNILKYFSCVCVSFFSLLLL